MSRVPPILFLLLGLILLLGAARSALGTASFIRQAERASGHVVDAGAGGQHPAIAFQTASGQAVQFQAGGLIMSVTAGRSVPVLYAMQDPTSARIGWTIPLFFTSTIVGAIGAALFVVALLTLWRRGI